MAGLSDSVQPPKPGDPIRAADIAAVVAHAKRLGAQAGAFVSGGVAVSRPLSKATVGGGSFWLGITEKANPLDGAADALAITAAIYKVNQASGNITGIQSVGSGQVTPLLGFDGSGRQTVKSVIPAILPYQKLVIIGTLNGEETILSVVGS